VGGPVVQGTNFMVQYFFFIIVFGSNLSNQISGFLNLWVPNDLAVNEKLTKSNQSARVGIIPQN